MAAGLRTKDARPDATTVFEPAPGDLKIAEIDKGPVIIARSLSASQRMVVVGFHPSNAGLRYELAQPLLDKFGLEPSFQLRQPLPSVANVADPALHPVFVRTGTGDFYDDLGFKQSSTAKFRDFTTNLHLEYGVRDKLGLVLGLPVRNLKLDLGAPPDLTTFGFGDLITGLRYRATLEPVVASVQLEAKFPTGYNATLQEPALGDFLVLPAGPGAT